MAHSSSLETPFRILFEDQHLIVLSKNPGLLSQGDASGDPSLVDLLRVHFGRNYVGLIHRLDRNTSGLMVVAKRSKSADRLSEQLKSGVLERKYRALLFGPLEGGKEQRWEHWLLKNEKTNEVRVVTPRTTGAKIATLLVTPIKTFAHPQRSDLITLAEFKLERDQWRQHIDQWNHKQLWNLSVRQQERHVEWQRIANARIHKRCCR